MIDFTLEPAELQLKMTAAASKVIRSGSYMLGKEVEDFEARWANICGIRFAVGTGTGLDAIEIALRCIGVGADDEVITTSTTAFATVLAILRAGATPVLADIDPDTALLSIESAGRCLSQKTRALVLVHLYGQVRDMPAWRDFCMEHSLELIEDCAQSHLASTDGRAAGAFGGMSAYSFYPTKNLGAPGDAGAVVTNEPELAEMARRLRNYGQSERFRHVVLGLNSRLDELQAAILNARLDWLPEFTRRRKAIADEYFGQIDNPRITLLTKPREASAHVYHLFVITCENRQELQAHLHGYGIESDIHYPYPIHLQEPCRGLKRDPSGLSASERHAATCLSIPCHPCLADDDVAAVIEAVNSFDPD